MLKNAEIIINNRDFFHRNFNIEFKIDIELQRRKDPEKVK
jgi:hypothetical protein